MSNNDTIEIPRDELFELYQTLARATDAAAGGDPNECASRAADAKQHVIDIREEYTDE